MSNSSILSMFNDTTSKNIMIPKLVSSSKPIASGLTLPNIDSSLARSSSSVSKSITSISIADKFGRLISQIWHSFRLNHV